MSRIDMACLLFSPLLWLVYGSLSESMAGAIVGFSAMFSTVYALMATMSWCINMLHE